MEQDAGRYVAGVLGTLGLSEDASVVAVGRAALGGDYLRRIPMRRGESACAFTGGRWQVFLGDHLSPARASWLFSWRLSAWLLRRDGLADVEVASLRSPVAAELLMPRDVITRACRRGTPAEVADAFRWPLAATLLRRAELERVPTMLVLPSGYVRRRGDDAGRLPANDDHARQLAHGPALGVQRYAVSDGVLVQLTARVAA